MIDVILKIHRCIEFNLVNFIFCMFICSTISFYALCVYKILQGLIARLSISKKVITDEDFKRLDIKGAIFISLVGILIVSLFMGTCGLILDELMRTMGNIRVLELMRCLMY